MIGAQPWRIGHSPERWLTEIKRGARRRSAHELWFAMLWIACLVAVIWLQHTYTEGGAAAWSTALRAGSTGCIRDMGILKALTGTPCPYLGAPRGFPFVLGGSEALAAAVVGKLTGLNSFAAGVPVDLAISLVGFSGGYGLLRCLGAGRLAAIAGSGLYATIPFTLGIQIFFGTGAGFILLPAYILAELVMIRWLLAPQRSRLPRPRSVGGGAIVLAFVVLQLWSAFLDGYTFVMSGLVGVCIFVALAIGTRPGLRRLAIALGVLVLADLIAVAVYVHASHGVSLANGSMDIYRGWGTDLYTLLKPTSQTGWANDLGAAYPRADLWGDFTSVAWNYFGYIAGALAIAGAVIAVRRRNWLLIGACVAGAIAFVLSLGPALKLNATIPPSLLSSPGRLQPPNQPGAIELPWSFIFNLPGVDGLRYTYRWSAVTRLLTIAAACVAVSSLIGRRRWLTVAGVVLLSAMVVEQLPSTQSFGQLHTTADQLVAGIRDREVPELEALTSPGDRVVFVDGAPVVNQYLANPLATMADVRSYNLGGDKNFYWSAQDWPAPIRNLIALPTGSVRIKDVVDALHDGADEVVFVDFDLVASINHWPVAANTAAFRNAIAAARRRPDLTVRRSGGMVAVALARPGAAG